MVSRQGIEPRLAVPKTAVRPSHSQGKCRRVVGPGVELGPTASEADMLSGALTGHVSMTPQSELDETPENRLGIPK